MYKTRFGPEKTKAGGKACIIKPLQNLGDKGIGEVSMKQENIGEFAKVFGPTPRIRVLEFFLECRELDFSIGDVAEETGLNRATAYTIMAELVSAGIVVPTRKVSGAQLYKLNKGKQEVEILISAFNAVLEKIANEYSKKKAITV